ncbi:MAG: hypothetical protein JW993_10235 [Sedimentisphaerales bacterium]|nr:hypothetical protein [Sedimentisphaerales bacterium]
MFLDLASSAVKGLTGANKSSSSSATSSASVGQFTSGLFGGGDTNWLLIVFVGLVVYAAMRKG